MVIRNKNAVGNGRTAAAEEFVRFRGDSKQVLKGNATVVRRVAVAGDPKATKLPKFDCGEGKKRSIFLGLDEPLIVLFGLFLEKRKVEAAGGTFEEAKKSLQELLDEFNASDAAKRARSHLPDGGKSALLMISPDPCSMPGHVWTGGGCKPSSGGGHLFSLMSGDPPSTQFGKVHNPTASFAYGYVVSVKFADV